MNVVDREWAVIPKNVCCFALCALIFALCSSVQAQQQTTLAKIGSVRGSSVERDTATETLRWELRALGYIEGRNIIFEFRSADNQFDRFPALVEEMIRLKLDVLVTSSTAAALAAKNATRTIPRIVIGVTDPVAAGLVDNLVRPGSNITGFTSVAAVLSSKRLELLKETVSTVSRVAMLWNPQDPASAQQWKERLAAGRELGIQLHSMEVSTAEKYDDAFSEAVKARIRALSVPQDSWPALTKKRSCNSRRSISCLRFIAGEIL
jgi:putative tryptophan/tyrosine transport system substrate-binding protein